MDDKNNDIQVEQQNNTDSNSIKNKELNSNNTDKLIEKLTTENYENNVYTNESEKLHITIIIDDENKVSLDFYPTDNIEAMCNDICKVNKIDSRIAKKLKAKVEDQMNMIQRQKSPYTKIKEEDIVNRLYTEAVKRKIIKDKYFEKIKNDILEKEMGHFSFTPKISENTNFLYNRSHLRIEDRLFYDEMKLKEKRNYQRIINDINKKELYENRITGEKINHHSNNMKLYNLK